MFNLQNVSDANDLLQKRCDDLQQNLEDAILQMDRTREDYLKLKVCGYLLYIILIQTANMIISQ